MDERQRAFHSSLVTRHSSFAFKVYGGDVLADGAAELLVLGVRVVGFEAGPVCEGGDEPRVVGARELEYVAADVEAPYLGDESFQSPQALDVLAPLLLAHLGLVLPDDDVRQHPFQSPPSFEISESFSLSSSHARRTWASAVRMLPTARRSVKRPFNFVCERKVSPVALTAFISRSLSASRRTARASSGSPSTIGRARKQTTLKGTGASSSQSSDASTRSAKRRARRQCSRSSAARPSWPK